MHFEASVALSGIISPMLYIRLRKAQDNQRKNNDVLLTEMSFANDRATAYLPVTHQDLEEPDQDQMKAEATATTTESPRERHHSL